MILKNINHICFDLDGTLMNSYNTIYLSTVKTLDLLKIPASIEEPEFYKRIGHHFLDIFNDLNINIPDIEHFINIYKSNYFNFIDESTLYPGAKAMLEYFRDNNYKVSLLTTKAQDQAEKILEHFELGSYFSYIMGRRIGLPVKPSPEPLLHICRELNVSTAETLIIGDTELDIKCGKEAGAKTCAVTFGYRTKDLLLAESPDFIIESYEDLLSSLNTLKTYPL